MADFFHEKLVRAIQEAGQDIVDNAEDYAGTTPYLSRMTITIDFNPEHGIVMVAYCAMGYALGYVVGRKLLMYQYNLGMARAMNANPDIGPAFEVAFEKMKKT